MTYVPLCDDMVALKFQTRSRYAEKNLVSRVNHSCPKMLTGIVTKGGEVIRVRRSSPTLREQPYYEAP